MIWHVDKIYGLVEYVVNEFTTNFEFIYNTTNDFSEWEQKTIQFEFFTPNFQDMISLPNGRIAIASKGRLAEINPVDLSSWLFTEITATFKNVNYFNLNIYFLSTNEFTNQSKIYKGLNGNFTDTQFSFGCEIVFFHIRNDGSWVVGCEDGIYVLN